MMIRIIVILVLAVTNVPALHASTWYASPYATSGNGSIANPWSLSIALNHTNSIQAGDTLWLRGGTYTGNFLSTLTGTSNNPIIVRNYQNERAIIDSATGNNINVLDFEGSGTWFWGLEIMNSNTNRINVRGSGVGGNVSVGGSNSKVINCIIHDAGVGVFLSWISTNAEVSGCIIYNNGYQAAAPDRGHGHGIYAQGENPATKVFQENIILNQFCEGIQIYSQNGPVKGFNIKGNTIFMNGVIARDTNHYCNIEVGGGKPVERITLRENMTYDFYIPSDNVSVTIGGDLYATNNDATIVSNCFVGGGLNLFYWTNITFMSNTTVQAFPGPNGYTASIRTIPNANPYVFDYNHYYFPYPPFATNGIPIAWSNWQGMGYDTHGISTLSNPTNFWAFVRPNPYEPNRANITIYNWATNDNVSVDVSRVLSVGNSYQVRNAADYLGAVVAKGTYSGGTISLPMTNLSVAVPIGRQTAPAPTGPNFNVFVLLPPPPSRPPPPLALRVVY